MLRPGVSSGISQKYGLFRAAGQPSAYNKTKFHLETVT
jgi:hypothetical protein